MSRYKRVLLFSVAMALGYLAARGALAYAAERRRRQAFPAKDAAALLNPLRSIIMPAGKAVRRYGLSEGETVLELGPGPGWYSREASRAVGGSGRLICLDIQRDMLNILRRRLDEDGSTADLVTGDAMRLPLRNGSLDCVFLVTVLGELPDHAAAVEELARITRPGGRVCFTESFGDPDYVLAKRLRGMAVAAGLQEGAFYRDPLGYTMIFRAA